jgi:CBS domain containing-hemolysin-like protein
MAFLKSIFAKKKNNSQESTIDEELQEEKQDMIQGIEDLPETSVKEVMIPRIDVDFINLHTTEQELYEKIAESGHSRFPVYSDSIDNVIGILYVKDLIYSLAKKEEYSLEKIIRKTYFVPESKRIDSLLREFKRRHLHIAMAIDEYGGISGIVTMEDIIEEIVGDIQDEFDNEKEDIIVLGTNTWLCDARVNLEDLNESLKTDFPATDFDSLGGFAFDIFGKIPAKFEKATYKNYDFIIQDMEGHRINVIKIIKRVDTPSESEE